MADGLIHDPRFAPLDDIVRTGLGRGPEALYPGAVLLVAVHGAVVHLAAYGEAQYLTLDGQGEVTPLFPPRPMTVDTIFDIASITKIVATTGAVMRLVDRSELGLDDRLGDLLPEFPAGDKAAISVRHLLAHRAGLWEWQPAWHHRGSGLLAWLAGLPLRYPVGERFAYSDLGFMLLGEIVARVAGIGFDDFVQRELLGPLGMDETGFLPDPGLRARIAATSLGDLHQRVMAETGHPFPIVTAASLEPFSGYRRDFLLGEANDLNAWAAGGGVAGHAGLFSTAPDLARFAQLILDEGRHDGGRLLSQETVARFLETPWDPAQALGFRRLHLPGDDAVFYGHPGYTGTMLHVAPALGLAVILLTNRVHRAETESTQYPALDRVRDRLLGRAAKAVRD